MLFGFIKQYFDSKEKKLAWEEQQREKLMLEKQKYRVRNMMHALNIEDEHNRKKMYHEKHLHNNFPLERGDTLVLENGYQYRVCKKEIKGVLNQSIIKLKLLTDFPLKAGTDQSVGLMNRLEEIEAKKEEEIKFTSMDQFNLYWFNKRETIKKIIKHSHSSVNEKTSTF